MEYLAEGFTDGLFLISGIFLISAMFIAPGAIGVVLDENLNTKHHGWISAIITIILYILEISIAFGVVEYLLDVGIIILK